MADSPAHITHGCQLQAAGDSEEAGLKESQEEAPREARNL